MNQLSLIVMLVSCMFMSFGIVVAQEDASDASDVPELPVGGEDASDTEILSDGAKISGHVVDSSAEKNPIEGVTVTIVRSVDEKTYTVTTDNKGAYEKTNLKAGRYSMNYAKDGYGERFGKSRVVAAGGEMYVRIIMRKKENIISFFKKYSFVLWPFVIPSVIVLAAIVVALAFIIVHYRKNS